MLRLAFFATSILCLLPLLSVFVMCTASCLAFFVPAGLLPLLSVFVLSLLCCALAAGLYCHERIVMSVCVRVRLFLPLSACMLEIGLHVGLHARLHVGLHVHLHVGCLCVVRLHVGLRVCLCLLVCLQPANMFAC